MFETSIQELIKEHKAITEKHTEILLAIILIQPPSSMKKIRKTFDPSRIDDEKKRLSRKIIEKIGGTDKALKEIENLETEMGELERKISSWLKNEPFQAIIKQINSEDYEYLTSNISKIVITRLEPSYAIEGEILWVSDQEVRSIIKQLGQGMYRLEYYIGEEHMKTEEDRVGGKPKDVDLWNLLREWGLREDK